jgi:hypothetical protein
MLGEFPMKTALMISSNAAEGDEESLQSLHNVERARALVK